MTIVLGFESWRDRMLACLPSRTIDVLSYGAGVNSFALLVLAEQNKLPFGRFDLVIFADTGSELPETYQHIEVVAKPLCQKLEMPFMEVGSKTLYKDYFAKRIIPYRLFRSCTDRYKIQPIKTFLKENLEGKEICISLGIAEEEKHRAKYTDGFRYPLLEMGIDRAQCIQIIEEANYPLPIKSGCYFCPFTPLTQWQFLLQSHRELFLKAEAFEKNCRAYPKYTLTSKPLHVIREAIENQTKLSNWVECEGACAFCHE